MKFDIRFERPPVFGFAIIIGLQFERSVGMLIGCYMVKVGFFAW